MRATKVLRAAAAALGAALLAECPLTPQAEPDPLPGGGPELRSDLFEPVEDSPGSYDFFTDNPDLQGPYGCTLWALTGASQDPFVSRELEMQKASGDGSAGFGAVLCRREEAALGETMLVILINTRRQFTVGEVCGTDYRYILPWSACPALVGGYARNRLRVQRDGESFHVSFNGAPACSFRDEEEPLHPGGADGLIVVISPLDRFPWTGVHVLFRELGP